MNKKILMLSAVFLAVMLATPYIGIAHASHASSSISVSGTFFPSGIGGTLDIKIVDANLQIWTLSGSPMTWTGGISGAGTYAGKWYFYKLGTPSFMGYSDGVWTLSATVNGKVGTLTIRGISLETNSWCKGCWMIIGGTGELADLHGGGTYSEPGMSGVYAYTGQVHFCP
jgi:hypothetical protein